MIKYFISFISCISLVSLISRISLISSLSRVSRISLILCTILFPVCLTSTAHALTPKSNQNKNLDPNATLMVLDRTIATVNNETITESELTREAQFLMLRLKQSEATLPSEAQFQKQVLDKMINDKIQLQMAKAAKIEIDEDTLNKTLEEIASRDNLSVSQMQQFIEEQGIPFDHFKNSIKTELTLHRLQQQEVGQRIALSKSEIENFINSPASQNHREVEYRLGHILISTSESIDRDTTDSSTDGSDASLASDASHATNNNHAETEALAIVKVLKSGKDFAVVAKEKSNGQQAQNGGDLGWRKSEEIPALFAKIVPKLEVNQIAGPIKNDSGYHIIKLLEKRVGGEPVGKQQTETRLRHIVIRPNRPDEDAQTLLTRLRQQAVQGTSFEKLAQKYTEDESKAKSGELGWVTPDAIPNYRKQIAELKSGEISQPFKTDEGWHLVQVLERRSKQASSDNIRQKATDALYQHKYEERLIRWVKQIREEANVKTFLSEN